MSYEEVVKACGELIGEMKEMPILLNEHFPDERIKGYPKCCEDSWTFGYHTGHEDGCRAQLKKVVEELDGYICAECSTPNFVNIVLPLKDWQSLKKEAGLT